MSRVATGMRIPLPLPLPPLALTALTLAWLLPGLVGHHPWKTEDAIGIGIAHQMVAHGQWWLPSLAGELYLEDGPAFHWLAALFAQAAGFVGGVLAPHDAMRLASGAWIAAALLAVRGIQAELASRADGDNAMLMMLGTLVLLLHAHEAMGENAAFAGQAIALLGAALAPRRAWPGGIAMGLGIAVAFLAKGSAAVVAPVVVALALPLFSARWRHRNHLLALAVAAVTQSALLLAWSAAAHRADPALADAWLAAQGLAFTRPTTAQLDYLAQTLPWALWPAWPVALWLLWVRRNALTQPQILLPLLALGASLAMLLTRNEPRTPEVMLVALPCALLGGGGVSLLRRGAANALAWFGAMSFTLAGAFVWLGWVAMLGGWPAQLAATFTRLEPGFEARFSVLPFLVASAVTVAWVLLVARSERSVLRSTTYWAGGVALLWTLIMTLWLPWIDYGKNYAGVARELRRAIPAGTQCIESRNLGLAQRAAFDYHAGVRTQRAEAGRSGKCNIVLVQLRIGEERDIGPGWKRIWEGSRPRERERYRLYVKN